LVLKEKGQVSIEFILIVVIALVYINVVVWPSVLESSRSASDIKAVADTKLSAMRLSNAINEATMASGDMKRSVNIFIPEGGKINWTASAATANTLQYEVLLDYGGGNPDPVNCVQALCIDAISDCWKCNSYIELLSDAWNAWIPNANLTPDMDGPLFRKVVIEKIGNTITVS